MTIRFDTCKCGKHGYIVLPDGTRGLHSCCKQHALHMARTGDVFKTFTEAEMVEVMKQIVASSLPETLDDADIGLLFNAELVNQAELRGVRLVVDEQGLHDLILDPNGRKLIPDNFLEMAKATLKGKVSQSQPH